MSLGQGSFQYEIVKGWGVLDERTPVKDCHAMVQDAHGRILLLTNDTTNNVIIYDKSGKLLDKWGRSFPGAHGMTLTREKGQEFLFITDHDLHQVFKTTLDGKILMTIDPPHDRKEVPDATRYKPTDVAVAPSGDFYVMDGYGTSHVLHYGMCGNLKSIFGGRGTKPESLNEAHGGVVDLRDPSQPTLMITSRQDSAIKRFTLDGQFLATIPLPSALPCDVVFDGEFGFIPQLRLKDGASHGFVSVIDGKNRLVSNVGGAPPVYDPEGNLQPLSNKDDKFLYPHGLCIDDEASIYVAQWNSNRGYPLKLQRI